MSAMTETHKNLKDEAERQILRVSIPGSGVVTKSGKALDEDADSTD